MSGADLMLCARERKWQRTRSFWVFPWRAVAPRTTTAIKYAKVIKVGKSCSASEYEAAARTYIFSGSPARLTLAIIKHNIIIYCFIFLSLSGNSRALVLRRIRYARSPLLCINSHLSVSISPLSLLLFSCALMLGADLLCMLPYYTFAPRQRARTKHKTKSRCIT
jgi:hypothetical protein